MTYKVMDLFNAVLASNGVAGARDYFSSNSQLVTEKVKARAVEGRELVTQKVKAVAEPYLQRVEPYRELALENADTAKSFVTEKIAEVRSADSVWSAVNIVIGALLTVLRVIVSVVKMVRDLLMTQYRHKVEDWVESVRSRAVELPNSPVAKRMEEVSRTVLGSSRHEQAVDFIKTNVLPRMALKSPSGSSNADLTTEGGSVAASSPRDTRQRTHKPKRK